MTYYRRTGSPRSPGTRGGSFAGLALAVAGVLLGATVALSSALLDAGSGAADQGARVGVADPPPPALETLRLPSVDALLLEADEADAEATPEAEAPTPTPPPAPVAPGNVAGMRVQLPGFGIDAPVIEMGVDRSTGQMEIPGEGDIVAWYGFTSAPGQPGNAVFAAHVTWRGERGAFWDLANLQVGDEIAIEHGGETFRYRVFETYQVRPDQADVPGIIGARSGPETVTLITCGGEFDPSVRQYEERVIVHAERIDGDERPRL